MIDNGVRRSVIAAVITISLFLLLAACGGGGDSEDAPGQSATITLTVSQSSIPADGASSTTITATIKDAAGNPVRHYTDVSFTTTLGYFRNGGTTYSTQTQPPLDNNGRPDLSASPTGIASASLIAGTTSGTAKVTVRSIGVSQTVYVTFGGAAAVISLQATPSSIAADGTSSSTIQATLTSSSGEPVTPGTPVTFTTGLGYLPGDGKTYETETQDTTGTVQISFRAGIVPGTTYVVATSGGVSQSVSIVLTNRYASSMSIKAEPSSIPADGASTSLVTATVKGVSGEPLKEVPVTFYDANVSTEPAPLPDDNTWRGNTSNDHVTPDFYCYSGNVSFSMTYSGSLTSNFAVRLWNRDTMKVDSVLINTTGPVTEETVTRSMTAGNYYFQVTADGQWEIKVDGSIGQAQAGTPKVLAVTQTDANGNAEYLYTSTTEPGVIKIRAETGELNVTENKEALSATVEITQHAGPATRITVAAVDSHVYANGAASTTIKATVRDSAYNPAPDGTVVTFSATRGTISPESAETVSGIASTTLTSEESATSVTSTVTGTVGEYSDSTTVTFVGVVLTDMKADPSEIIADGAETSTISCRLQDETGAAISGETILFSTTGGTLETGSAVTNDQGLASVRLIAPSVGGSATVTAAYGLISKATEVSFIDPYPEPELIMEADPTVLEANGDSRSDIRILVRDKNHNPVESATVSLSADLGTVVASAVTDKDGYAKANGEWPTLTSEKQNGIATVTATYLSSQGPVQNSVRVTFTGVTISVSAEPESLQTGESSQITVTLKDPSNTVIAGQEITLTTTLGNFSSGGDTFTGTTGTDGKVTAYLTSTSGGTAQVKAYHTPTIGTAGETWAQVEVTFSGYTLSIEPEDASLVADGASSTTVHLDLQGPEGPVQDQEIILSTTLGTIDNTATTDAAGKATATLTAGDVAGIAVITATAQLADGTMVGRSIEFSMTSGVIHSVELIAQPAIISVDTGTSSLRAIVKDAEGNPVGGVQVSFTIVSGPGGGETIVPARVTTPGQGSGSPGQAEALFSAGSLGSTTPYDVLIRATAGDGSNFTSDTVSLTIVGRVANLALGVCRKWGDCVENNDDGTYSMSVGALVSDVSGIAVPAGYLVHFSTETPELGAFISPVETDSTGTASTTFTYPESRKGDDAIFVAQCEGVIAKVTVTLPGDDFSVDHIDLEAPQTVLADAFTPGALSAVAKESDGEVALLVTCAFEANEKADFTGNPIGTITNVMYYSSGRTTGEYRAEAATEDYPVYIRAKAADVFSNVKEVLCKGVTIAITPTVDELVADGESSTMLTALVKETTSGKPLSGAQLYFGTDVGTVEGSAVTDGSGIARVRFTSPYSDVDLTANVSVFYGPDLTASTRITLTAPPAMGSLSVSANPTTIYATPSQTSTITAQVMDINGNPVPDGTRVKFRIVSGPGQVDREAFTEDGMARATFTATSEAGDAVIEVSTGGLTEQITIHIIASPVGTVTVTAGSDSIPADGASGTLITALVKDKNGDTITDGTLVSFTTTAGTVSAATATTLNGEASVTLTSSTYLGTAVVTATCSGISATVSVSFTAGPARDMVVSANPDNLSADGVSTSTIRAKVTDIFNNPISGETVSFSALYGTISPVTATTDANGIATVTYTAPDTFPPSGTDTVTGVSTNGTTSSTVITLIQAMVGSVTVTAGSSTLVADGSSSTVIIATVKDINNNPVPDGTAVSFTTTAGTVSSSTAATTNGMATVTLKSSTNLGTATVTATSGGVSGSGTITFIAGPVATLTVTAIPDNLSAGITNTSTVTAKARDLHNNPVSGETITFTVVSGRLSAATATTDADGIATVTYTAPDAVPAWGTDTVTAASTNGTSGSDTITILPIQVGSVTVTAADSTLVADGLSSTLITAAVKDTRGNNVPDGTAVSFAASAGALSSATATTTNGTATVTLTSSTTLATAVVTATSGGMSGTVSVTFIAGPAASVSLVATPETLLADGSSTSTLRAEVLDQNMNRVADGEAISFVITSGTGTLSDSSAETVGGFATVTYTSSRTPGDVVIQAMAPNGISDTVTIALTDGEVATITLTASPATIPADGSSSSAISAALKDQGGNPVVQGTSVLFTTDLGTFANGADTFPVTTPDDSGEVTVSLIAGTEAGTANITAASGGVSQAVEVVLTGTPLVGSVEVTADPVDIPADGASTGTITATVKTADNQVIPDVEVTFTTTRGAITSPHTSDEKGVAEASLRSDRYNDSSVVVTARCQGVEGTATVSFSGIELSVKADPANLLAGDPDGSTITATLKDAAGNAIRDAELTFSTDKGALDHPTGITDAAGQASAVLTSGSSGIATVTVSGRGASATAEVNFTRYLFTLERDPSTIRVGETCQITATLLDSGVGRSGETVYFSTTLGTLFPWDDVTGGDGKAFTTLTAGTQAGIATVDANVTIASDTPPTELSATTTVVITGGDADKIVLTAAPDIIGTDTGVSTITAMVYDANDQPSPEQDIYFRINSGPAGGEYLSASIATTDEHGIATVLFYAGALPSAYEGVEIEANTEPDFTGSLGLALLTIAGPVAHIGVGMNLETLEPDGGNLKIDISAIATDVSGNPVADGTKVNFSVQAVEFDEDRANDHTIDCWDSNGVPLVPCPPVGTPGFGVTWFSDDVNQDGTMYSLGGPMCTTEDVNHNGILDPGEDKNDNGVIDPIQGTVIDESVDTTGGVAPATLIYPAPQANNIKVRVTASAGGVSNFYETILLCTEKMVDQGTCGIGY